MEQSRIEFHAVALEAALDADASQRLFPVPVRCGIRLVEVHLPGFGLHVLAGVFDRRVRQADFQAYLLLFTGVETQVQSCSGTRAAAFPGEGLLAAEGAERRGDGVRDGAEIHRHHGALLVGVHVDGFRNHPALDASVVGVCHRCVAYRAAFTHARTDVEEQVRLLRRREGIAVEPDPFGRRQLGLDAVILQQHRVIARARHLVFLVEARTVARVGVVERPGYRLQGACRRGDHYASNLELMEVGEAFDRGVA